MKKILSVLSVLTISATTAGSVTACSNKSSSEVPTHITPITKFFKEFNFNLIINQANIAVQIDEQSYSLENTLLQLVKDKQAINSEAADFLKTLGITPNGLGEYFLDDFNKIKITLDDIDFNPTTEFGTPNVAPIAYRLKMQSKINDQTILVNGLTKRKEYTYAQVKDIVTAQLSSNNGYKEVDNRNYLILLGLPQPLSTANKVKDIEINTIQNTKNGIYLNNFLNFIGIGFNQSDNSKHWKKEITTEMFLNSQKTVKPDDNLEQDAEYIVGVSYDDNNIINININGLKQWIK